MKMSTENPKIGFRDICWPTGRHRDRGRHAQTCCDKIEILHTAAEVTMNINAKQTDRQTDIIVQCLWPCDTSSRGGGDSMRMTVSNDKYISIRSLAHCRLDSLRLQASSASTESMDGRIIKLAFHDADTDTDIHATISRGCRCRCRGMPALPTLSLIHI